MEAGSLTEVRANLEGMGSSLPEAFCRMAAMRLESFGYTKWDAQGLWSLAFSISKVEQEVLDYCHVDAVPKGLYPMLCDRSCGHFMYGLKQSGRLEVEGIDLSGILTSLSEGDVKVDFDKGASDEARLDALLGAMMISGKEQLACYRRLRF
jgi:hypothetical protein